MLLRVLCLGWIFVMLVAGLCSAQEKPKPATVLLWPEGAPMAQGTAEIDKPRLTIFVPKRQTTRTAVVICPGGAYVHLATDHEGRQVGEWLNNLGVVGVMLEYRLGPKYHYPVELLDAQRAVRYVRAHAAELKVAPDRIGIMGFSAGGHLASTVATHFDGGAANAADPLDRVSSRPDFAILAYPVIHLSGPAAEYSFKMLLGEHPDEQVLHSLFTDTMVTAQTPPTFLVHADDDDAVFSENSVSFYLGLKKAGVPAEMHIYQFGGHGFGLAPLNPVLSSWSRRLEDWMRGRGLLVP